MSTTSITGTDTATTPPKPAGGADPLKVNVGILTTAPTPYRLALHNRIDREIPEIRLFSLYSHDLGDQPWQLDRSQAERSVSFGKGQRADRPSRFREFPRDFAKGGRIIDWITRNDLRAIVVGGYSDLTRLRLLRWCARNGIPAFLNADSNIHLDAATGLRGAMKHTLLKWVVRHSAGIMPCGSYGRDYYLRYGAAADRIFYFPYEPDYSLIEGLKPTELDEACAKLGLRPGRHRIVFCARMTDFKKPDMAIDAFAAIAARRPDWDLVMIGNGPMLETVKARLPSHLRERVHFAGFIAEQRVISAIYRASDVFLHPSVYEPWGVVINEAACAGMAIVAARTVGAVGELLRDGVNGRVFETGDIAGMTEALLDATDASNLARYKFESRMVLAAWRALGDPVQGLRSALLHAGVIEPSRR